MMTWSEFRQLISQHFNAEDIRILCFDLDIDYDNLPGERKDRKVAELIDCLRSRKRIPELVDVLNNMRPPIHWEEILPEFEADKPVYRTSEAVLAAGRQVETPVKNPPWFFIIGILLGIIVLIGAGIFLLTQRPVSGEEQAVPPPENFTPTPSATPQLEDDVAAIIATDVPNTPTKTATPTVTPTSTIIPILVEPVGKDEYMVLVTELEHLGGEEREFARFVADDLRQQLEVTLPNSRIRIREYDEIIPSKQEAAAIAEQVGADIIIWGNYDEDGVLVDLQVGSLAGFPNTVFDRDEIGRVLDVRATLTDEREQSLAIPIVFMLVVMAVAENDTPEMSRLLTMTDFLPQDSLDFEGNSMAARYHRGLFQFIENPELALPEMDAALLIEQNPLLYMGRGIVHAKLGDMVSALSDWSTSARLGPDEWFMPQAGISFGASMAGELELALANANHVVTHQEQDDWYGYYLLGVAVYLAGDVEASTTAFQEAIDREPTLNWPYTFAMMAALRQGNMTQAKSLADTVLHQFPDPTLGIRILQFIFGDGAIIGPSIAATSNLILGQFTDAIANADAVLAINPMMPDMYFVKGFSQCNLGNYAEAETAYSQGIDLDPAYTLLYLLRAEARQLQGSNEAAFADIEVVKNSPDSIKFFDLLRDAQTGTLNCQSFLTD